jgi:hypothetical protein
MNSDTQAIGFGLGVLTFVSTYIYCIATYGFLFGVGLGWLPAIICALVIGFAWPVIVVLGAIVALGYASVICFAIASAHMAEPKPVAYSSPADGWDVAVGFVGGLVVLCFIGFGFWSAYKDTKKPTRQK